MHLRVLSATLVSLAAAFGLASCGGEVAYSEPELNHATLRVDRLGVVRDLSLGPEEVDCLHWLTGDYLVVRLEPLSVPGARAGLIVSPLEEAWESPGEPGRYFASNRASGCEVAAPICCLRPCVGFGWTVDAKVAEGESAGSGLREDPCFAEVLDEGHGLRVRFACEDMYQHAEAPTSMWGEAYCATKALRTFD